MKYLHPPSEMDGDVTENSSNILQEEGRCFAEIVKGLLYDLSEKM